MAYNNFGGYGGAGSQKRAKRMMGGDYMGQQAGDGIYNFASSQPAEPAGFGGKKFRLKDKWPGKTSFGDRPERPPYGDGPAIPPSRPPSYKPTPVDPPSRPPFRPGPVLPSENDKSYGGYFGRYSKPTPVGPGMPMPPEAQGGGATPGGGAAPGVEAVQPMRPPPPRTADPTDRRAQIDSNRQALNDLLDREGIERPQSPQVRPPRTVDERRAEADLRRQAQRDARDARRNEREDLKRPQSPPAEAIGGGPVETAPAASPDRRVLAPEEGLPPGATLMSTMSIPPQYFYQDPETGQGVSVPEGHPAIKEANGGGPVYDIHMGLPSNATPSNDPRFSSPAGPVYPESPGAALRLDIPSNEFLNGQIPVDDPRLRRLEALPGRLPQPLEMPYPGMRPPPPQGYNYFDGSRQAGFGPYGMNPFGMRGMGGMGGMGGMM